MTAKMSAEWREAEARRYCELHIAAHHKLLAAEVARDAALEHLSRLVDWGWGEGAPDGAIVDWKDADAFLAAVPKKGER